MIPGQVGLPPNGGTPPEQGGLWDSIFGPLLPLFSTAWWLVLHVMLPLGLIGGLVGMIFAGITGSKQGMARSRGMIMTVPLALFLVSAAVLVSNWIIKNY